MTPSFGNPVTVTVQVKLAPQTPPGNYSAAITAGCEGAPAVKTQILSITVKRSPDFLLSTSSSMLGSNGRLAAAIDLKVDQQDGYSGTLTLGCSVEPAGPECAVSPSNMSTLPATAQLTITPGGASAAQDYQVTVTATDGSATRSATVLYRILDYNLTAPQTYILYPTANSLLNVTSEAQNGYRGIVNLSCAIEAPASCFVTPSQVNFAVSPRPGIAIYLWAPNAPATYSLMLSSQDTAFPQVRKTTVPIVTSGFTLQQTGMTDQTVAVGGAATYNLLFTPYNGYNFVTKLQTWTCNPPGAVCQFEPSDTITPTGDPIAAILKVSLPVTAQTSGGDSSFNVFGSAAVPGSNLWVGIDKPVSIHVQDFALTSSKDYLQVMQGNDAAAAITAHEFAGLNVPVQLVCPPKMMYGVTCKLDKSVVAAGESAIVTISAASDAVPAGQPLTITSTANIGGTAVTRSVTLTYAIGNIEATIEPNEISLAEGGEAVFAVYVGTTNHVKRGLATLTCAGLDPGITCEVPPEAWVGYYSYVTVRSTPGVASVGRHSFNVNVSCGGETKTITATLVNQGKDSLVITSPNGNELWSEGTQYITWKYSGNPGENVRIDLLNKGIFDRTIADHVLLGVEGKGFYTWAMPSTLPFSQHYQVRVTSIENPSISDIRVWMGIGADINYPGGGEVLYAGDTVVIGYTWSKLRALRFELYKGGNYVQKVSEETISGYIDGGGWTWDSVWWMPADFPGGTDYRIRVVPTADESRAKFADGTFTIVNASLKLTAPMNGEVWRPGTQHTITWTHQNLPAKELQLFLNQGGYNRGVIAEAVPLGSGGTGSYTWTVPVDLAPARDYTISAQTYSSRVFGAQTDKFAIGDFYRVAVSAEGNGYIGAADSTIQCPQWNCTADFPAGTSVTLTAAAAYGYMFDHWSGDCSGAATTCSMLMNSDKSAVAHFKPNITDFQLTVSPDFARVTAGGTASYTVTLSPYLPFNDAITLSCSGLPAGASCNFATNNLKPGQQPFSTTLAIKTTAKLSALKSGGGPSILFAFWIPGGLASICLLAGAGRTARRRGLPLLLVLALLLAAAVVDRQIRRRPHP